MNFGTFDLQNIIYKQLVRGNVEVRMNGGRGKFAKDLAKVIYNFVEDSMNFEMVEQALARGATQAQTAAWVRVCNAFDRNLPMQARYYEIYTWAVSQDSTGRTIEKFAQWARQTENLPYINQYFKDPQNIKTQWQRAFTSSKNEVNFNRNDDGSLYV